MSAVQGMINRIRAVPTAHLHAADAAERDYAASELHAFLLGWLASFDCPMLNPPAPELLAGPSHSRLSALHFAAIAGLGCRPMNITTTAPQPLEQACLLQRLRRRRRDVHRTAAQSGNGREVKRAQSRMRRSRKRFGRRRVEHWTVERCQPAEEEGMQLACSIVPLGGVGGMKMRRRHRPDAVDHSLHRRHAERPAVAQSQFGVAVLGCQPVQDRWGVDQLGRRDEFHRISQPAGELAAQPERTEVGRLGNDQNHRGFPTGGPSSVRCPCGPSDSWPPHRPERAPAPRCEARTTTGPVAIPCR